jgi:hypothetical protein
MRLTKLSAGEASTLAVETLGLNADAIDLTSLEGIFASLRRAASFMCPTSPSRLIDAVLDAIRPLQADKSGRNDIADALDLLVTSGDLLELRNESGRSTRLLYLAPPSYIERATGTYLLMGIRPLGAPLIEDDLAQGIDYEGHTRILTLLASDADSQLQSLGLQAIPKDRWVARPSREQPAELIERYRARLDVAGAAGHLDELQLLDPTSPVRYYSGRWRPPAAGDNGDFIARRPQAYGADLWCLIRFESGVAQRLVEMPVNDPVVPGRDEAWRYQAAIDALRGQPQTFRVRASMSTEADNTFDFFGPLPGFAERYMELAGLYLGKTPGALFSYRVPGAATGDTRAFMTDMLWMTQEEAPSGG